MASCGASAGTAASEWLRRGESLLAKRPEQARACFSDAALADQLSYRAVEQLGLAQLDQHANVPLSTAAATLRRAAHLALRQGNQTAAAAVHRAVGEAHARRQDWAPASTAFAKAFKLAPTDCVLSAHLAQARAAQGQHKRAVAALRAALAEDHACLTAHQWLARVLPSTGDLRRANPNPNPKPKPKPNPNPSPNPNPNPDPNQALRGVPISAIAAGEG